MKTLGRWPAALLILAAVGLADSIYLTIDSFSKVALWCPTVGILDCGKVTQSPYSHPFGIPVALLGLLWFAAMFGLGALRPSFRGYLLLPLWLVGIIMVAYLVYVELGILHAICIYCTLAHVCTVLLGIPALKMTLSEE